MPFDDTDRPTNKPPASADRRTQWRVDVLGQILAHSVWRLRPIHLRELSETGFSLESNGPFESDTIHKFRIGTEGQRRSVVVQARTRHSTLVSHAGTLQIYVTGFELVNQGDHARREIQALLQFAESMWDAE